MEPNGPAGPPPKALIDGDLYNAALADEGLLYNDMVIGRGLPRDECYLKEKQVNAY